MAEIMSTDQLAKYLKLNPDTIRRQAEKRTIPSIRIGRVWRFSKMVIDEWIKQGGERK